MKLSDIISKFPGDRVDEADGIVLQCPSHNDSRPSLKLALTDDQKVLLTCRAGCTVTEVLQAAGLQMRDLFDVDVDLDVTSTVTQAELTPGDVGKLAGLMDAAITAGQADDAPHWEYIKRRFGLSRSAARSLDLGFDPGGGAIPSSLKGSTWEESPRLVVPFKDFEGNVLGAQGRALDPECATRWCSLRGTAWSKMAVFDVGTGLDTWVVTEGPTDALALAGIGINSVAIRGAALRGNGTLLRQLVAGLHGHSVFVCGDADEAGRKFAEDLATRLIESDVEALILPVPDGANDLASAYEADPGRFVDAIHEAMGTSTLPTGLNQPVGPPSQTHDGFTLDDAGNGERLVNGFNGDLVFTASAGWMVYDSGVWSKDELGIVHNAAQAVGLKLISEGREMVATANGDAAKEARGKKLMQFGTVSRSSTHIAAILREAQGVSGVKVPMDRFDQHPHLLAVKNGVINLMTGKLQPHDRELYLTRRLNIDFDPRAKAPRWEQFLTEVFPHSHTMPDYMQRLVGYGITGLTREQCFAILWGTGANGKSVFTDTLSAVFNSISNTTPFSTFEKKPSGGGIPNDLAALQGARLVFASEGDQGVPMAEAVLKRITGSDLITARFMRQEFFSFHPTFLLWLATNYKPSFRGQDEGLWRRVKLIPFTRKFKPEERDHYLTEKLKGEAEGILAWAVEGARSWFRDGLEDPYEVVKATSNYRATQDALEGFFPGIYERAESPQATILAADVYKRYVAWAEEEDLPFKERWSRKALYAAFDERGIQRVKTMHGVVFIGLAEVTEPLVVEEYSPLGVPIEAVVENKTQDNPPPVSQLLEDIF